MRYRPFHFALLLLAFLPSLALASSSQTIEISVVKGDNLINICKKYLEDPTQWREVARVNRLRNPDLIYPGQKLIVPLGLLRGVPIDGVITFLKGHAELYIKASGEWKQLKLNDRIGEGNWIMTGGESAVEITFEDGVSFLLRANTSLGVTSAQKKGTIHRLYGLFLDIGRSISKVRKITGKESRYEIRTPSAVAAARGTEFRVSVDNEAATRCEVLEGTVGVEAKEQRFEVKGGEGTLVVRDKPPIEPKMLLSPPEVVDLKPLYRAMPLEFSFQWIEGAFSYRVMLAKDGEFKDVIKERVLKPEEELTIVGVEDGSYFLQSRSIDEVGLEGPPYSRVVNVRVNPLPPFIQSPLDGAEYREREVQFKWLKVQDAVKYHIQVARDPEFRAITEDRHDMTGLEYKTGILDFGTYYFRAKSIAADGYEGIWSDVLSFKIIPPPPSPPVEKPEMGKDKIQIRWRYLGGGIRYHFQMARDEAFTEIITDKVLDDASVTLQRPKAKGIYYVRTSAVDSEGYEGSFSLPQTFEIEEKFPSGALGAIITGIVILLLI